MSHRGSHLGVLVPVFVAIWLTACVGGQSKPANFYRLVPEADPTQAATTDEIGMRPVMAVGPMRLPEYLQRPQIVTRSEGARVEQAEFERWAGPLEGQIEAVLIRDLATELQDVAVVSHRQRSIEPAYRVTVNFTEFVGRLDGYLELNANWTLILLADEDESRQLHSSRIQVTVKGADYAALVQAHQQALTVLSQQIAEAVLKL